MDPVNWFQLYVYRDRGATEALVRRIEVAGCTAFVLTVNGERGVARVLDILRGELDRAMALCGCASIHQITRDLISGGVKRKA